MIFYHVSRPHPTAATSAPLVRICCTSDPEQDSLIQLTPRWLARAQPGESVAAAARRLRSQSSAPSIYVPASLHADVPAALLISEYEVSVCHDLRVLQRARTRRDFTWHHQGTAFTRLRFALGGIGNPLLRHAVLQFLRSSPAAMFPDLGLSSQELRAAAPTGSVTAPDGTRFNPETGEVTD